MVTYAKGTVYSAATEAPLDEVYTSVYGALEENRFFVVFEADMGRTLSRFAERWGEDYNRNQLQSIRSMVVCNAWYTNQVSNKDPSMLSLCPLTVTLIHKEGITTVLFARPTVIAEGSPAQSISDGGRAGSYCRYKRGAEVIVCQIDTWPISSIFSND